MNFVWRRGTLQVASMTLVIRSSVSAEGEHEDLHARIEKLDLELAVGDGSRLSNQLIHPGLGDGPVALLVHIDAVRGTGRLSVDEHPEAHRLPCRAPAPSPG